MKVNVIGQRSRSPCQKCDFRGICIVYWTSNLEVKGLGVQGQGPHGSRSKVTVANKGRWAHINVKLLHYLKKIKRRKKIRSVSRGLTLSPSLVECGSKIKAIASIPGREDLSIVQAGTEKQNNQVSVAR